jgi:membrane-bound inhibitor of C-type lysozyme
VPAASGAKYEGGSTTYWSKGDSALLTLDGVEHTGCRMQPLRAP